MGGGSANRVDGQRVGRGIEGGPFSKAATNAGAWVSEG